MSKGLTKQPINNGVARWQEELRAAIFDGITAVDVATMVSSVVKNAKAGDPAAVKLVFDYILGGKSAMVVNNTMILNEAERPAPTSHKPGTKGKVAAMAARAAAGLPLSADDDADFGTN